MNIAIAALVFLCGLLLSGEAAAGAPYNLRTVPLSPAAGQPFLVVFDGDPCEEYFLQPPGSPPTVNLEGSVLNVAVDRIGVFTCDMPATTYSVPASGLLAGNYSVQLIARELQAPQNVALLESIPLNVGRALQSVRSRIPVSSYASLAWLALAILGFALWAQRR